MTDEKTEDCPHCGADISDVIAGLKTALEKTREEKRNLKDKAKETTAELGKAKTLLDDANEKLKDANPETSQQLRTELNVAKEALAATVPKSDFDALTTRLEESTAAATKLQDDATSGKIATAVAAAGGNFPMLSPMIKAELVKNPKLNIAAHVAKLRNDADFGGAFKASDHSGGGGPAGRDTLTLQSMKTANLRRGSMSDKEKNEYQKEHGLDALLDLPL